MNTWRPRIMISPGPLGLVEPPNMVSVPSSRAPAESKENLKENNYLHLETFLNVLLLCCICRSFIYTLCLFLFDSSFEKGTDTMSKVRWQFFFKEIGIAFLPIVFLYMCLCIITLCWLYVHINKHFLHNVSTLFLLHYQVKRKKVFQNNDEDFTTHNNVFILGNTLSFILTIYNRLI